MNKIRKNKSVGPVGKGNTKPPTVTKKRIDNRPNRAKNWILTWNNYSMENYYELLVSISSFNCKYIIGKECGASGTYHLQGYIESPKKLRWSEFKLPKEIHWEVAKGTREENIEYCSKENNYVCVYEFEPLKIIEKLHKWQSDIEQLYYDRPDGRTVHWYYDKKGGKGKSSFCKYMYVHYGTTTIQGGKMADIMNIIYNMKDVGKMILIDIPRASGGKISESAVECILNGMITNTKYETGKKVFNPPHVVIFSNSMPELENMSANRWNIINLAKY